MFRGLIGYWSSWRRRGFGLVTVMIALLILTLFTGAIMFTTVKTLGAVADGEYGDRARYAAYSGIQSALEQLNSVPDASHRGPGWSHAVKDPGGAPCPAIIDADREDVLQVVFQSSKDVQALVVVYNNSDYVTDASYRSATAPDGTPIPHGSIYISSTGIVQGKKKLQLTSISSLLNASGYNFDEALFAAGKLHLKSGLIDSFDSAVTTGVADMTTSTVADAATYAGMTFWYSPYINAVKGSNATLKATIASNDTGAASVELADEGPLVVDGDVKTGTGAVAGAVNASGDAKVWGTEKSGQKQIPQTFKPSISTGYITLGGGGGPAPSVVYSPGATWTLTAGKTYFVDGDLLLDGTQVVVTGGSVPATIYVKNNLDIKNNASLNWGQNPKNLQFYVMDENLGNINLKDAKGSLVMAAGGSKVNMENVEVFGSIQANEITTKNSKVHFDTKLMNNVLGKADFTATKTMGDTTYSSPTVTEVVGSKVLPPAYYPPAPGPGPGPGPAPAPAPGPGGCGGCGGCLMQAMECL